MVKMRLKQLFVISLLFFTQKVTGQIQTCSKTFKFSRDSNEDFGVFFFYGANFNETYDMNVNMTFRGMVPSGGQMFLLEEEEKIIAQKIEKRQPLRFKIRFPVQDQLPLITVIKVNNKELCNEMEEFVGIVTSVAVRVSTHTPLQPSRGVVYKFRDIANLRAKECTLEQFKCNSGHCIPLRWSCDGKKDCIDGSDEDPSRCSSICPDTEFRCKDSNLCITANFVCDGDEDCSDGSDEINCELDHSSHANATNLDSNDVSAEVLQELCGTIVSYKPLVLGGKIIDKGSWPWLVALFINDLKPSSFQCGGNLISSRTVLTAAHCVKFQGKMHKNEQWLIVMGRHNLLDRSESTSKTKRVEKIVVHPDFDDWFRTLDGDIAIMIVKETIPFSDYIRPVCLWTEEDDLNKIAGEIGSVVGWGKDETGKRISPEPNIFTATIVSNEDCLRSSSDSPFNELTSNRTICAGDRNGVGPCTGDSGGGLVLKRNDRWVIRGLLSASLTYANNTCNLNEYAVYSDIPKFNDWVLTNMVY